MIWMTKTGHGKNCVLFLFTKDRKVTIQFAEAVATYIETNDLGKVAEVHEKIIRLYKRDFSKYESRYKLKLQEIYDAMPGQLDQKNKQGVLF